MTSPFFFDGSDPVLTPDLYLGTDKPVLPETFFLFFYDSHKMKELQKKNRPVKIKNIPGHHFIVDSIGYKKMLMGCDMSVFMLELLIACGVKKIIVFGTACSISEHLQLQELCMVEKAICEEAVSMHYASYSREVETLQNLNTLLLQCADKASLSVKTVKTCTIPALFRETEDKIAKWRSEGVSVLDMEASALITVANAKSVKISFLFFISDRIIENRWEQSTKMDFSGENRMIDRLLSEING